MQKEIDQPENDQITTIRNANFAGKWYPDNSDKLETEVKSYLDEAKVQTQSKPRLIIVPHPGLSFGGRTQGYAYKTLANYNYRNIFLIGVSHHKYLDGISVGKYAFLETPLGKIKTNLDIIEYLLEQKHFYFDKQADQAEHALEMQLPFLQLAQKSDFQIIPILLSASAATEINLLAETIYKVITPDDLIVISSDLSHYPQYKSAKDIDDKTIEAILSLNSETFANRINKPLPDNNTDTYACGEKAILAGLKLAHLLKVKSAALLHYENSGDTANGDKDHVVGYAAVSLLSSPSEAFFDTVNLSPEDKKIALDIARESIFDEFKDKKTSFQIPKKSQLNSNYGVFVTIRKNGQLRGCIGNFSPTTNLANTIYKVAKESAFDDPRFSPLDINELDNISLEISVLSSLKQIKSYKEIIPGKHGVYIKKGFKGGTYLPQVAIEQDWDREEMLNSLTQEKASMEKSTWQDGSAAMYTYTANVFSEDEIDE